MGLVIEEKGAKDTKEKGAKDTKRETHKIVMVMSAHSY